jgi:hypothetical protein
MGIETAIMAIGAAASAASAIKSLTTKAPKAPTIQPLTAADKPPAAAKTPDRPMISKANAAAGAGGPSSTFLTGPSGVDPSTLNLGKNTLLGQ